MPFPAIPAGLWAIIAVVKIGLILQYVSWKTYMKLKRSTLNREEMIGLLDEEIRRLDTSSERESEATVDHLRVLHALREKVATSPTIPTSHEVLHYLVELHDTASDVERGVIDSAVGGIKKHLLGPKKGA